MAAETERLRVEEHRLIAENERLHARLEEVESQLADAQALLGELEARDQQRGATIRRLEEKVAELEALTHDGWGPYDCFRGAFHQQCLRHLMNRCQEILQTATGIAARFPRQVLELIEAAFAVRREHEAGGLTADQMVDEALTLGCRLEELAQGRFTYEPNRTLAQFLLKHATQWFWFLIDPEVDATNYQAEQAIRPAVVNRKVRGGNRTDQGAEAQSILMSVFRTCTQAGRRAIDFLVQVLCAPRPGPQLLAGR